MRPHHIKSHHIKSHHTKRLAPQPGETRAGHRQAGPGHTGDLESAVLYLVEQAPHLAGSLRCLLDKHKPAR